MSNPTRRDFIQLAAIAGISGATGATAARAAGTRAVRSENKSMVNAMDFGAVGDGKAGDDGAIQKALDTVQAAGGGEVFLPAGVYRLNKPLVVEKDVALTGVYQGPISHAGIRDNGSARPDRGTVLVTSIGSGSADGDALITVGENSTLAGLAVFYPDQNPEAAPAPYPWTINMIGNNATVRQVELVNSYQGIRAVGCARHTIREVTGQPLRTGIYVDEIYDIGRIENVHWNPWWSASDPVISFMYRNGEGFVFARSDWEYVFNTFCFGYRYGYKFIKTKAGVCNGNFLGIGADASWNSVGVEDSAGFGILITNGEFVAMPQSCGSKFPDADARQVLVEETNTGVVRFVNSAFWGPGTQNALIKGSGTVGFSDCTFMDSNRDNAAIEATSGCLLVRGCEFRRNGVPIAVRSAVAGGSITGNIVHSSDKIINESKGDLQVGLNSYVA
jgi:hypothetical protein